MRWSPDPVTVALAIAAGIGWLGFPGLLWDVAWHRTIGRDSFFSPPHLLMYSGVAANGLVAAWGALRRGPGVPGGFGLAGMGVLLAVGGATLDEYWHRYVAKDVNLWSPSHLVGLAGTMLIVLGLVLALAAHTRYAAPNGWRPARWLLPFFFADLVHKSMVALDHYTLDAGGRTPDFYLFLVALLQPAILVMAVRALGPGAATAVALVFTLEHAAILSVLLAAEMRVPTFSPIPILPALAVDLVMWASSLRPSDPHPHPHPLPGRERERQAISLAVALPAGLAFALLLVLQETAWMAGVVGRPWDLERVAAALPSVALAAAGSAWVGWALGGFVRSAAEGRPASEIFGGLRRRNAVLVGMLVLVTFGLLGSYRPSRAEPPAKVAALGLAADTAFDYRDAVFWPVLLPDDWKEPGVHRTYQEGIIDGRPFPLGPAWCAPDERALEADLARIRLVLTINGEAVGLDGFPAVRRRMRDGQHCQWIGLSATTPRPGLQELVYTIEDGSRASTVIVDLRIKEP